MYWLLTLLLLLPTTAETFYIKVSPQSFFAGSSVVITCHVPRHLNNRTLRAALFGYTYSDRDLDGERAAITHRFEFKKVPCGVEQAACIVTDAYNSQKEVTAPLVVAGCDGTHEENR